MNNMIGGKTISRKVLLSALLLSGSFSFSKGTPKALLMPQSTAAEQMPTVTITQQEEAPLRFISTWVASKDPKHFRLVAQVQNSSAKNIRAYAVISQTATSTNQNGNLHFMNLTQNSGVWRPTEIRALEFGDTQESEITSIRLSVDFIEFTDGATWGPDTQNSRDMLAGQRDGAKLERLRLDELLQNKGRDVVIDDSELADSGKAESELKGVHSVQWLVGFRSGVNAVHRHVKEACGPRDSDAIKAALNKKFDTSEEEQK
jgi:hypothetical protein